MSFGVQYLDYHGETQYKVDSKSPILKALSVGQKLKMNMLDLYQLDTCT